MSALSYLSVIRISGEQAQEFLQGQVSCDMQTITPTQASLGTLCNLKGRMMASFIIAQTAPDAYVVILHQSLVDAVVADLKKYAVFAKADIEPAQAHVIALPATDASDVPENFVAEVDGESVSVYLPRGRRLLVSERSEPFDDALSETAATACDIDDALPWISGETADKFLPQAFFSDASTAVSYEKGCYKGQEVVARMHFRGQMKEGLKTIDNHAYTLGQELRDSAGKLQGVVVWVAEGTEKALAVMKR